MKVGILGTGDVGKALGDAFLALGHDVKMGSRTAGNDRAVAWAAGAGTRASASDFEEAARFGDLVVLATLGAATEDLLRGIGPEPFEGKTIIDATNPLDFSKGYPPSLFLGATDSLGERIQRLLPGARVVKAFNTVGNALMFRPDFRGGPPDMFICGDDERAKWQVAGVLEQFGWGAADIGGIEGSRYLEPMCMVWVGYGAKTGSWRHAFKLLRK